VQYSLWKDKLTEEQQRFFNHSADKPLKLRGPAGSGKTLTLELKALREMYAAREAGSPIRILYATHSWEMAEQVDAALASLDETGSTTEITIFPLIEIAKSIMPPERQASGLSLLGHDSLSGKRTQLQRISSQASAFKKKDWLAYAIGATDKFRQRVETSEGSPIWNSLIWDLMHEFSSVLAASSILPSITAERRYLSLNRTNWMMPLQTDSEKKFVFRIYASYLAQLKADRLLSVDQLITDFLSYLESFAWDYRRNEQGFDLIFVDELHLFSDPERHVLNLLTRDPSRFPSIFMALDPRQAPSEVYFDFPITSITSRESGDPERSLGKVDSLELTVIHRFSPQILNLIKFINNSFPTFYLGTDWVMDISALNSRAEPGGIPKLYRHDSTKNEVESVISRVKRHVREGISSDRLAVILIEENRLDEFIESVQGAGLPYVKIQNRDDIDTLRYAKRSIVFAAAEYIAGLQFEEVIVAGFPVEQQSLLNPHQKRRILSLLYLAISRASIRVELHLHSHTGEFAVLLEPALAEGVLDAAT